MAGPDLDALDESDARWDAILYNLVVLGEAATRISNEVRARAPEIDWRGAIGMRNVITHDYFGVKRDAVIRTVRTDLPPLRAAVERLLPKVDPDQKA